jgi:mono/diheme cytochrome c family protein
LVSRNHLAVINRLKINLTIRLPGISNTPYLKKTFKTTIMKNRNLCLAIALTTAIILFHACRHEIPDNTGSGNGGGGNNPPPTTNPCSADTVYFVNEIMPIISSNCTMSGCHDNITHAGGIDYTSYTKIMKHVKPGNAADSKIYKVIIKTDNERMPPPPMPPLTQVQKDKIYKWISQGAKNNFCASSCDTAVFTYSGAVKNIMQDKCVGCHNPASLGGNIDLSTYTATKTSALNGKLYGSVAHLAGYSPMPKNSAKLSDCEIKQIQKWVNAGAPNN